MILGLTIKNKLGFIDGTPLQPQEFLNHGSFATDVVRLYRLNILKEFSIEVLL